MLDPDASAHAAESLYRRLGGYDAIAAFVADLMPRLYNDPTLWVYWKGKSRRQPPQRRSSCWSIFSAPRSKARLTIPAPT